MHHHDHLLLKHATAAFWRQFVTISCIANWVSYMSVEMDCLPNHQRQTNALNSRSAGKSLWVQHTHPPPSELHSKYIGTSLLSQNICKRLQGRITSRSTTLKNSTTTQKSMLHAHNSTWKKKERWKQSAIILSISLKLCILESSYGTIAPDLDHNHESSERKRNLANSHSDSSSGAWHTCQSFEVEYGLIEIQRRWACLS